MSLWSLGFLIHASHTGSDRSSDLWKRPETTLCFEARIAGEILQDVQSYFRTRPKQVSTDASPRKIKGQNEMPPEARVTA
jgi:hypothetical protein